MVFQAKTQAEIVPIELPPVLHLWRRLGHLLRGVLPQETPRHRQAGNRGCDALEVG